jgi:hypothetical protein
MFVDHIAEKIETSIHNNSTEPSSSINVMKHALINLLNEKNIEGLPMTHGIH